MISKTFPVFDCDAHINDPEQKYTLKSLPGNFSGLQLLAIMYAGLVLLIFFMHRMRTDRAGSKDSADERAVAAAAAE